jgi:hypothetical protein
LPALEDTSASATATAGAANAAGKATSLPVSATKSALVRFGAGNLSIPPANVRQARLTLFVGSVLKPGTNVSNSLLVKLVNSNWHEASNTVPLTPTLGSTIANLGVPTAAYGRQFVICDVTATVKSWLATPSTDFGFAVTTAGATSLLLGSKEGSAIGYPASLEIDDGELGTAITIAGNGNVGIGTTNTPGAKLQILGPVRIGSETGTSEAPNRAGLIVRRINSTSSATNQIVARSGGGAMTLERDGTPGGFVIKVSANAGGPVMAGIGIDCGGNSTNVYKVLYNGGGGTTTQIFTTSQSIGHFRLSFGDALNAGDMTEVDFTRFVDCAGNDSPNWAGTVTSTVDQ